MSTSLGFERSVVCVEDAPSLELRTQIQALAGEGRSGKGVVGGGRHLILRGKGKRTDPGSSRVKGGTALEPGERTLGSDSPAGQPVRPTMSLWQLQLTSPILLTGKSRPLSTCTWHLYITTPHLDWGGGGGVAVRLWSHTHQVPEPARGALGDMGSGPSIATGQATSLSGHVPITHSSCHHNLPRPGI